jgi:hypothetical protein
MRAVLLATVAGFTGFFVMLTLLRCRQLRAADRVAELEADLDVDYGFSGERA